MTTSTPHAEPRGPRRRTSRAKAPASRGGFTLAEVIVATSLSTLVLAGVLSTFLLIGRTGLNASAYASMNGELRVALEYFNRDVRLATDVRWTDQRRLTLVQPPDRGPAVTYAYEPAAAPAAPGRFTRQVGDSAPRTLVASVAPDFAFARYRLPGPKLDTPPPAANDLETKLLEVRLRAVRPDARAPAASQLATSARCVMRNKTVGQ